MAAGGDIELGDSITEMNEPLSVPVGITATLDLKGFAIDFQQDDSVGGIISAITVNGTLTVKDTNDTGTPGKIYSSTSGNLITVVTVNTGGVFTLESGHLEPFNSRPAIAVAGGIANVEGGEVYAGDQVGNNNAIVVTDSGTLNISGGKIYEDTGKTQPLIWVKGASCTVNLGGAPTFVGDGNTFSLKAAEGETALPAITAACDGTAYSGGAVTIACGSYENDSVIVKDVTDGNKGSFALAANDGGKILAPSADNAANLVISDPAATPPSSSITVGGVTFDTPLTHNWDEYGGNYYIDNPTAAADYDTSETAMLDAKMTTLDGGSYYLTENLTFKRIIIRGDVKLCLNGFSLTAYNKVYVASESVNNTARNCYIQLTDGATLSVYDSAAGTGQIIGKNNKSVGDSVNGVGDSIGTMQAVGSATLNLYGGTVTWMYAGYAEANYYNGAVLTRNQQTASTLTVNINGGTVERGDAADAISATDVTITGAAIVGSVYASDSAVLSNTTVDGWLDGKTISLDGGSVSAEIDVSGEGGTLTLTGAPTCRGIVLYGGTLTTKPTIVLDSYTGTAEAPLKIDLNGGYTVGDTIVSGAAEGDAAKFTISSPLGRGLKFAAGAEGAPGTLTLIDTHDNTHPYCGATCAHDSAHTDVEWTAWGGTNIYSNGNYALSKNVSFREFINIPAFTNICLNGYTLTDGSYAIKIKNVSAGENSVVNLCDCAGGGAISGTVEIGTSTETADASITLNVYGGELKNASDSAIEFQYNGLVPATLNLYGGTVSGGGNLAVINGEKCDNAFINLYGGAVTASGTPTWASDEAYAYGIQGKNINLYGGSVTAIASPYSSGNGTGTLSGYAVLVPDLGILTLHNGAAIYGSTADVQLYKGGQIALDSSYTGNGYEGSNGKITLAFTGAWATGDVVVTGVTEAFADKFELVGTGLRERPLVYDAESNSIKVGELPEHTHSTCNGTIHSGCTHENVTYTAWESGYLNVSASASYYLATDNLLTGDYSAITIPAGVTINLCLNGHKLSTHGIVVNGTLNICDCKGGGLVTVYTDDGQFSVPAGGALNLYDVDVLKALNSTTKTSNVINSTGGSVSVYDGSITVSTTGGSGKVYPINLTSRNSTLTLGGSPAISGKGYDINLSDGTMQLDDYIYNSADYATKKGQLDLYWYYSSSYISGVGGSPIAIDNVAKFVNNYLLYSDGKISKSNTTTNPVTKITAITAPATAPTVIIGETVDLNDKITIAPSSATDKQLAWVANTPAVATISRHGVVKGVSAGTATITGYSTDGSGKTVTCTVIVSAVSKPTVETPANFTAVAKSAWSFRNPAVSANGLPLTGQGWEIKIGDADWTSIENGSTASFDQNGAKLRYFAKNKQGTGYSAEATLTVNKIAYPSADAAAIEWPTASGITYGDALSSSALSKTDSFAWKNSDEKPAVSNSGCTVVYTPSDADYTAVEHDISVTVSKKELTPAVATVADKVYNGDTETTGTLTLIGAVNGESPAATGTFAFVGADVGTNKTVNVTGMTLSDDWGDNYALSTATLENQSSTAEVTRLSYTSENTDIVIAPIPDQPYTGSALTPDVNITAYGSTLVKDTDYTLAYANNTAICDKNAKTPPKATITFIKNLEGTKTVQFSIVYARLPESIQQSDVFELLPGEEAWWSMDFPLSTKTGWQVSRDAQTWASSVTLGTESTAEASTTETLYVKNGDSIYSVPVSYKLDKTKPTIENVTAPSATWGKDGQTISFTPADSVSGVVSSLTTVRREKQGEETAAVRYPLTAKDGGYEFTADRNGTYTITVKDNAGNSETKEIVISKIDKTAPEISWETAIDSDKWYGEATVTVIATDNSGEEPAIALKNGKIDFVNGKSFKETGVYAITATATDAAGNTAELTCTLRIETRIKDFVDKVAGLNDGSDVSDLMDAKKGYDELSATVKDRFSKNDEAVDALAKLEELLKNKAQDAADTVSEEITTADTIDKIEQAKKDFDALPDEVKNAVSDEVKQKLEQLTKDAEAAKNASDQLKNADKEAERDGDAITKPGGSYEEKESAKDTYEKLTKEQEDLLKKDTAATENKENIDTDLSAINKVLDLIDNVKKPYTAETKTAIENAKKAYEDLTQKQEDAFPKAEKDKLTDLTGKLEKVKEVETLIKALPETYPEGDTSRDADIISAKGAYDALTEDEKAMVDTDLKAKLDKLYKDMLDTKSADEKAAADFAAKVEEVAKNPTADKIEQLIKDYDKLSDEAKGSLSDKTKNDYEKLKKDYEAAKPIIDKLDKIDMDKLTPGDIDKVKDALGKDSVNGYDDLTDEQKKLVDEATGGKPGFLDKALEEIADATDKVEKIRSTPRTAPPRPLTGRRFQTSATVKTLAMKIKTATPAAAAVTNTTSTAKPLRKPKLPTKSFPTQAESS